jgi:hypothetical protein
MWRARFGLVGALAIGGALASGGASAMATGPSGITGTTGSTTKPRVVACPANAAAGTGAVQWTWSAYGKPSASSSSVSYSQTTGAGTWNNAHAKGTICSQDQGGRSPKRSIVLKVSGTSKLTPNTTKLGLLGVAIVLPVAVSKSGDPAVCPIGSTGTVALFASYFSVHHDKATMTFTGSCAGWDQTFSGAVLHVEIARDGHEVK